MSLIRIDGESMLTVEDLHTTLKEQLQFPDYYGANLDALWDCLLDFVDEDVTLQRVNFEACQAALGETANAVLKVLREAENENGFRLIVS